MSRTHLGVRWEVSYDTSQNVGLTGGVDEVKIRAEPRPDDCILRTFISDAYRHGERRHVLGVGVEIVFVFTFDTTLRVFHGLQIYGFAMILQVFGSKLCNQSHKAWRFWTTLGNSVYE